MVKKKKKQAEDDDVADIMKNIRSKYDDGAIQILGKGQVVKCEAISTGSISLDAAIGIGGMPRGRIIEIYGEESSGKTTLALSCIANAQKAGMRCGFIDAEHAIDPTYAGVLGVDMDSLLLSQPDCGEQALDIMEMLVDSEKIAIIVIDSVAALTPQAELDGEMGDAHVGRQARLMGQAMRKLVAKTQRTNTMLIFTNQIRMKVGVMFGSPKTTPGGKALKFYASVRLETARTGTLKQGETPVGSRTKVTVRKNKVGPPLRVAEFDILYAKGINRAGEVLDAALANKIIKKSGAWFKYGEESIGQGRGTVCEKLETDEAFCKEIEVLIEQAEMDVPEETKPAEEENE